jgi:vitamin B12 transporter
MQKKINLSLISVVLLTQLNAQDVIKLDDITVTGATKSKQSIKDITPNVSVITSTELEEKHYTDIYDALKATSGIIELSNGGVGSTVDILLRGMGNNRTLVLIDGIRVQDPSSTAGANMAHIMIDDIERIEVIKGAQSGIWGADASAGVINIITKDAKDGTHGGADIGYGSFDTKKLNGYISYKDEKIQLKLDASKITSDSFSSQAPRGEDIDQYEDDPYENTTINLKASYNITNNSQLFFSIRDIDALKDYDSYGNPDDTTLRSDVDTTLYALKYNHKLKEHDITIKYENTDFKRDEIGTIAQWGYEYVKNFNGESKNLELYDNFSYTNNSFLIAGIGKSSDFVEYILTDNTSNTKENKNSYIYATNSNQFENIILTQSIRYDNYDNFENRLTGKIGAKYNASENLFISSNIATGYNVPNIMEELNPWGATNNDLNPEDATSYDITMGYKGFEITYFYHEIKDLIEWYDADGYGGNPAIYKNLDGKSKFKGIEMSLNHNINDDILLTSSYTYLDAKDKDGEELQKRPKHTLNIGVDYYGINNLHMGLYGSYIGTRYNNNNRAGAQTGRYTVIDAAINYDINQNASVYAKINNLFDRYYQTSDGYASAGFNTFAGLKIRF